MNSEPKPCPDCGVPIPINAPQGLCPKCLMSSAAAPTETGTLAGTRPTLPAPSVEEIAHAFPQLQIIGLIGQGGMGFVYRARQPKLERDVALKILPQHLAAHPGFAERFAREGKVLAKLNHPNIVSIFDFGESGGYFYLLMEFVDGVNLRQAMRASRFTAAQALSIVPRICEALQFAHEEGVLHRDIKPENILLDAKGRVKIADFGIAKLMERGSASRSTTGTETGSTTASTLSADGAAAGHRPALRELTAVSATLGTPQYMAPEQIEHPSDVDHRADIYSLGVVFYELLTGELPLGKFAPPSAKTPISERVDEIVMRALAKEREQRQQSAGELKTQVETAANSLPPSQEPATPATQALDNATAWALGFAMFYTGLVVGIPLMEALPLGRPRMAFLLFGLTFTILIFLTWVLGYGASQVTVTQAVRTRSWIRGFAAVSAVTCLPVCGFGIFILANFIDELSVRSFSWNPSRDEAFIIPLAILGMVVLPWSSWKLSCARRTPSPPPTGRFGQRALVNPWPHRLFWLIVGPIVLLIAAVIAGFLAPALQLSLGNSAGLIAGLVPVLTGVLLFWGGRSTRPSGASATPGWNPWPKRIFWLLVALGIVPAVALALGLLLPSLYFRERAKQADLERARAVAAAAHFEAEGNPFRIVVHVESPTGDPVPDAQITVARLAEPFVVISALTDGQGRANVALHGGFKPKQGMAIEVGIQVTKDGYVETDAQRSGLRYLVAATRPQTADDWTKQLYIIPREPLTIRVVLARVGP